jgi:hypothetical protein
VVELIRVSEDPLVARISGSNDEALEFWYEPAATYMGYVLPGRELPAPRPGRLYFGASFPDLAESRLVPEGSAERRALIELLTRIGHWTVPAAYGPSLLDMLEADEDSRVWLLSRFTETERIGLRCLRFAQILEEDRRLVARGRRDGADGLPSDDPGGRAGSSGRTTG